MSEPAPYGTDLPRDPLFADGRDYSSALAALDAANAEVLALRAERDRVREICERWLEEREFAMSVGAGVMSHNCSGVLATREDCGVHILNVLDEEEQEDIADEP